MTKIRSYQVFPELLRNRFCKKCEGRIVGRSASAKLCLGCAYKPAARPQPARTACEWCAKPLNKGRFCKFCSMASARKKRQRLRQALLERDGGKCRYCQAPLTLQTMTIDHFIPRVLGGTDAEDNLRCACITCNVLKGATHPDDLDPEFHVTKPERLLELCSVGGSKAF